MRQATYLSAASTGGTKFGGRRGRLGRDGDTAHNGYGLRHGDFRTLGKLPIRLVRRLGNGGSVVVKDHPLPALLQKPNAWQTRLEFIKMMQ